MNSITTKKLLSEMRNVRDFYENNQYGDGARKYLECKSLIKICEEMDENELIDMLGDIIAMFSNYSIELTNRDLVFTARLVDKFIDDLWEMGKDEDNFIQNST